MYSVVCFTFWYLITCAYYTLSNASALIGQNVRPAKENEFPFVVALALQNPSVGSKDNYICTGSVISKKHVLTAAHCFANDYDPKKYVILAGSIDLEKGAAYEVASCISFNDWSSIRNKPTEFVNNDIAIVTLAEGFNPKIKPAIFSKKTNKELYGTFAILAGWGMTERGEMQTILQTAKVAILRNDECEKRLRENTNKIIPIQARMFCSVADPYILTSCGDSGSPVLNKKNKIIGISRGVCPKEGKISKQKTVNIHLGIDYYREFIKDVLKNF